MSGREIPVKAFAVGGCFYFRICEITAADRPETLWRVGDPSDNLNSSWRQGSLGPCEQPLAEMGLKDVC
jgi:hypothetical protein